MIHSGEEIRIDPVSTIKWFPNFLSSMESAELYQHLLKELDLRPTELSLYGKSMKIPRLQAWLADESFAIPKQERFLSLLPRQHPWTLPVSALKSRLERELSTEFDYCLVNFYRDQSDYIGFHADNEAKDVVASLSLGSTRRFLVKHLRSFGKTLTRRRKTLTNPKRKEYEFSLTDGSLIVMLGDMQSHWKHSVPKEKASLGPRLNLTFRTILR